MSQFIVKRSGQPSLEDMLELERVWDSAVRTLGPLPDISVYTQETWEWTVVRAHMFAVHCSFHGNRKTLKYTLLCSLFF